MNPLYIDIALGMIAFFLMLGGYRQGFVRTAGSLLALVISLGISLWGVTWLEDVTGFDLTANTVTFVFVFLILAVLVSQLLRIGVNLLDLVRKLLSIIPFVGLINSLLGMLLGAAQAGLVVVVIAFVAVKFLPDGDFRSALLASRLVSTAITIEQEINILK